MRSRCSSPRAGADREFHHPAGKKVTCAFGQTPTVDGRPLDYSKWKLFEGPYLNSEVGSRRLTITHGPLERVLDLNALTATDRVRTP